MNKIIKYVSCLLLISLLFVVFPFDRVVMADTEHTVTILIDQEDSWVDYGSQKLYNGDTVSLSEGAEFRVYAKAADGYKFDYAESEDVSISVGGYICRLFTMSSCDVTIIFHFVEQDPFECNLSSLDLGQVLEGYASSDHVGTLKFEKLVTGNMVGDYFSVKLTSGDTDAFSVTLLGGGNLSSKGYYNVAYIVPSEGLTAGTYTAEASLYYDQDGSGTAYEKILLDTATISIVVFTEDNYHTLTVVTDQAGCQVEYSGVRYDSGSTFELIEGQTYSFFAKAADDFEYIGYDIENASASVNGGIGIKVTMSDCDATLTLHFISTAPLTGWQEIDGSVYYYDENGEVVTDWQKIDGKWYFFDKNTGVMKTGYKENGDKIYYLDPETGIMSTGWTKISGKWYYFSDSGVMKFEWQKIGGKWYFFGASGAMITGWCELSNNWYYFGSSGAMVTGWQKISGKWYYFNTSGAMQTGWQKISNKWYYFASSGAMATGWQKLSNKWYYFNASGVMQTGWYKENGNWYYFKADGSMATGSLKIGNKTYNFTSSGVCKNP